jgi:hypothetical protein
MPKYFKIEKLLYICIPIIIGLNAGVVVPIAIGR